MSKIIKIKKYNFYIIILFLTSLLFFIGCSDYPCCTPVKSASIGWPSPVVKIEKKEIKKQVEQPEEPATEQPEEPATEQPEEPATEQPEEPEEPATEQPEEPTEEAPITPQNEEVNKEQLPIEEEVVAKPDLDIKLEGEKEGKVNVAQEIECIINNKGEGISDEYKVKIILPENLKFVEDEKNERIKDFEPLAPDTMENYKFKVISDTPGDYEIRAQLLVNDNILKTVTFMLTLKGEPKLGLKIQGPKKVNMNKEFDYKIKVKNEGTLNLKNILVQDKIPNGLIYVSSIPEGKYKEKNNIISWRIGDLAPGEEKTIILKVTSIEKRTVINKARAKDSDNLVKVYARIKTEIMAEIGLQIQHYDTTDPLEVGEKTTYVVELINQGYKDATNIEVVDIIPKEASFIEANVEGSDIPINYKVEENKVIFDTIDFLTPGKKIVFRITVKVKEAGDLLNTVQVKSSEFKKPLISQEGTKSFEKEEDIVNEEENNE